MKESKTNAMRILDKGKIPYGVLTYESHEEAIDGVTVALSLDRDPSQVFKTLIVQGHSRQYYVAIIPSNKSLDLKKLASMVGEKSVDMIAVKDINAVSGYVRGGCSPIGMKKQFGTLIDASCQEQETIIFSAGKIGLQLEVSIIQLLGFLPITSADICQA